VALVDFYFHWDSDTSLEEESRCASDDKELVVMKVPNPIDL